MQQNKAINNQFFAYVTFLVWPIFSLIYALVNYRSAYSKNIVWLFCAFFGYTFIISNPDMDANRYKDWLVKAHKNYAYDYNYIDQLKEPYLNKGIYSGTDIYSHFLTTTVALFTKDFRILFAIVGLIYGYFYSRNIFLIIKHCDKNRLSKIALLIIVTMAFIIPFWNINGYRFYTAAHIFIFAVLKILLDKDRRFALLILLSPLVHFSFILPSAVLCIYYFVGNKIYLYIIALIISLFFIDLNPKIVNENAELAPLFMQNKVKGYSSIDYVKEVQKSEVGMNWYVKGHNYALYFCLYTSILLIVFKRKYLAIDKSVVSVISLGILLFATANLVSSIPSMGRFYLVAAILLFSGFALAIQNGQYIGVKKYIYLFYLIPLSIFLIVEIRIGFDFIGLNTLFLNPLIAPFFPDSPALIDLIK